MATRLRIIPPPERAKRDTTATHTIPSGMGGVFDVEVLARGDERSTVRIHMPRTDWHHWRGAFEVDTAILKENA